MNEYAIVLGFNFRVMKKNRLHNNFGSRKARIIF